MTSQIRVCVIGAGAAGICAARHLSKLTPAPNVTGMNQQVPNFLPVIYEQSDTVGGTWAYNDMNENVDYLNQEITSMKIHSSMYKDMHTNLPKQVMAFPDFSFSSNISKSFLHHTEVHDYLKSYVDHFNLERFINFKTEVINVKPCVREGGRTTWEVQTKNIKTNAYETHEFDGVMVCNGHYSVPNCPDIPGLGKHFKGDQIHSHFYRIPQHFVEKTVLVLGASASGVDIGLEITKTAKKVYLSHNKPKNVSELPDNMEQIAGVVECTGETSFVLSDGCQVNDVDVLLFCTGYKYSFPFLDESCGIEVANSHTLVKPLYKHMININHPSMCFIGVPIQICPFPQFDLQCKLYRNVMAGIVELPGNEVMLEAFEDGLKEHIEQGRLLRHYHKMGPLQWDYNRDIARFAKVPEVPLCVENLYNAVHERRTKYLTYYKNDKYIKLLDNENGEYVRSEDIS